MYVLFDVYVSEPHNEWLKWHEIMNEALLMNNVEVSPLNGTLQSVAAKILGVTRKTNSVDCYIVYLHSNKRL